MGHKTSKHLWGDSIFALRALNVVIHGFTSLVIYQTGNILFNRQVQPSLLRFQIDQFQRLFMIARSLVCYLLSFGFIALIVFLNFSSNRYFNCKLFLNSGWHDKTGWYGFGLLWCLLVISNHCSCAFEFVGLFVLNILKKI